MTLPPDHFELFFNLGRKTLRPLMMTGLEPLISGAGSDHSTALLQLPSNHHHYFLSTRFNNINIVLM